MAGFGTDAVGVASLVEIEEVGGESRTRSQMVTNYPQQLAAAPAAERSTAAEDGLIARAVGFVSQRFCAVRGHDSVLHFEENRVRLRCTSCGYDSPGWEVNDRRPNVRYARADEQRFLLDPDLKRTA
jgi:hypothetical protein